jgi:hypothetical protein
MDGGYAMSRRVSESRPGFRLVDLVVVVAMVASLIGCFFPAASRYHEPSSQSLSRNNLRQIGIALNNFAEANNHQLPNVAPGNAPFFFCGQTGGTATRAGQPSPGPAFQNSLLSFMEGNVKCLAAPLDPNLGNSNLVGKACSYSIPAAWSLVSDSGTLKLPESFKRGTSQCIGAAEMTTEGVNYTNILPFSLKPYTPAAANTPSTTANSFSSGGCQTVMMDGSVRNVNGAANGGGDFVLAQQPDNMKVFSPNW